MISALLLVISSLSFALFSVITLSFVLSLHTFVLPCLLRSSLFSFFASLLVSLTNRVSISIIILLLHFVIDFAIDIDRTNIKLSFQTAK